MEVKPKPLVQWLRNQRQCASQPLDFAARHVGKTAAELDEMEKGNAPVKSRDFAKTSDLLPSITSESCPSLRINLSTCSSVESDHDRGFLSAPS